MPAELAATPQARLLAEASDPARYNIVEMVYRSPTYEGQYKDFEFSRRTMNEHWQAGYAGCGHDAGAWRDRCKACRVGILRA
jgi:NTE family protein